MSSSLTILIMRILLIVIAAIIGLILATTITLLVVYCASLRDKDPTVGGAYFVLACLISLFTGPAGAFITAYVVYKLTITT